MPTYLISWTATVRGVARVDADNAQKAEQVFCEDAEPPLDDCRAEDVTVQNVDEAEPGVTWN